MALPNSQGPPAVSMGENGNGTCMPNTNRKGTAKQKGNVVLIFGCQWLSFTANDFRQLRADVLDNPENHWMLDVLGELPAYYRLAANEKYLPSLQTIRGEEKLQELERWFRCDDLSTAKFPLSYTLLAPLLMMTHFVQYAQYTKSGRKQKDNDEGASAVAEIAGFCIGFLSAVVVSAAKDDDLRKLGSVALRLAMLLGAIGDVQEAEEEFTSLATAWKRPELESEMNIILKEFPGSYITVQYDENRATIMAPRRRLADLQQTLQAAGLSANPVDFNGRYHWTGHEKILASLFALCDAHTGLQLPDASDLLLPPRLNTTGEPVRSGPLHQIALRAVLVQPCLWYNTFSAIYQNHLIPADTKVVEFGPERCIPPTFLRRLPQRVIHFADEPVSPDISRDHELSMREPADTDIAIVGMACRVAGADDLPEFWDLLCAGESQHTEMPHERYANYETPWRPEASKRVWYGNFVRDIDAFDHKFFKKSPREAMSQDPQQRLLLQVAYQALESAGYFSSPEKSKDIGCYIASCTVDYEHNVNCHPPSAYAATGLLRSFLAGKLSHYFGWRGPSLCVDTACSGSAVALHHACRAILNGDCTAALVGGANAITSPLAYDNLAGASFLSPTGGCKPFDKKADGYCRGEGFAAIYIKKLSDALAEGDQVLATIASTAVEQNNNCTPIVVPDAASLAGLFEKVTSRAHLHPRDITVVEAHGTGTQAGDPAEYRSVRDVLGGPRRACKLALGSVKGLVGHTEGVSGMIALCKVVLMIQNGQIPPQPGFNSLNSQIKALPDDNIEIGRAVKPWEARFRAALINNYGACGSNASMIVTQGPREATMQTGGIHATGIALPFRLCGFEKPRLQAIASRLREWLSSAHGRNKSLADVAYNITRQSNPDLEYQYHFQARSISELGGILSGLERGEEQHLVRYKKPLRPLVLCFGGQVGRSVGLDRSLYALLPLLKQHLDSCDELLRAAGEPSIYPGIFSTSPNVDIVQLQAQLFALQYACARSWISCGVTVAAVVGHSFGELTALCISGVLSLKDALTAIVRRAALIRDVWGADPGSMLAVEGDKCRLNEHLKGSPASIACFNGPRSFTVAGPTPAIDALQQRLESDSEFQTKRLDVTNAFHSSLVDPLLPALEHVTDGLLLNQPHIPIERATADPVIGTPPSTVLADHLRHPVHFSDAVQRLAARYGPAIWLEAGSNSTITSLARRSLGLNVTGHTFHSTNLMSTSALKNVIDATMGLWRDGIPCTFWAYHGSQANEYVPILLPPYQFEKSRHWMENKPLPLSHSGSQENVEIEQEEPLFSFQGYEDSACKVAKYLINTDLPRYVRAVSGHVAAKTAPLAPASVLLDYAVELIRSLPDGKGKVPSVHDVGSDAPLLLDPNRELWIEVSPSSEAKKSWELRFQSQNKRAGSASRLLHCTARIVMHDADDMSLQADFTRYARLVSYDRCAKLLSDPDVDDILQGRNVYRSFAEIVEYSEQYQGVQKLVGKYSESAGRVVKSYSGETWADAFLCDSFSQCAGFWVNCMTERADGDIYIASGMEQWVRTPRYADMATSRPDTWHIWARHQRSDGLYTSDLFVFTPNGELVEMFLGLQYSRVARSLFIRLLGGTTPKLDQKATLETIESEKPSSKDLVDRIRSVVAEFCAIKPTEVRDDSHLADAGVDSLMAMELARELEDAFNCTLAVEALIEAETFRDLVRAVQSALRVAHNDGSVCSEATGSSVTQEISEPFMSPSESVSSVSDTVDLELPYGDVLHAFSEIKALTDQFLVNSKCSGRLHDFTPLLVRLCLVLTLEAFQTLGSDIRSARAGDRLSRIEFDVQHDSLVAYLYNRLVEAGLIALDGETIMRTETPAPAETSSDILKIIETEYPEYAGASKLTFFTASKLSSVLRGQLDGLQLIFGTPEGQQLVSWMYGEEPHNVAGYKLMAEFIRRLVHKLLPAGKEDATLRILEMGAGTGGGTKWFLPVLAALSIPVEYTFSDISPAFLAQARRKFRDYPLMRYCIHDIEKPPAEELQGRFHIIIASNAVHATSNLQVSTSNMRQALRPDGVLMMLEMTQPVFAIDLVFGLFRGWWVFNDGRTHAITSERRWKDDLHAVGYGHVDWTDGESNEVGVQRVIFATASGEQQERLSTIPQEHAVRLEAVEEYVHKHIAGFAAPSLTPRIAGSAKHACVLVTGATGSLGSHLVAHLVGLPSVGSVICLNRMSKMDPKTRQVEAMAARKLHLSSAEKAKLLVIESDTTKQHLGLSVEQWANLLRNVTHIVHNAWPMNGLKPLPTFEGQFLVLSSLIDLAGSIAAVGGSPVRFQFISSIGTVNGGGEMEQRSQIEKVMSNGYNEAKFVCERMLQETLQRYPATFQAMIARPGQIAGSQKTGYWNTLEHFPAMVKSSQAVGAFPALTGRMGWTPVDAAARILTDLLLDEGIPEQIYHVDHPVGQDWAGVVDLFVRELGVTKVPFKDWLEQVREHDSSKENPAGFMANWLEGNFERMSCQGPLDTRVAKRHSRTMQDMSREGVGVGEAEITGFVRSWKERRFLA
ncbi:putative polyketide synthase [Aspergillus undulatus]|uniref:putative polyketide synthase n=1 Tax=Aspergillus undulatus TaxID=1810928 RepID=UPI003CCD9C32